MFLKCLNEESNLIIISSCFFKLEIEISQKNFQIFKRLRLQEPKMIFGQTHMQVLSLEEIELLLRISLFIK